MISAVGRERRGGHFWARSISCPSRPRQCDSGGAGYFLRISCPCWSLAGGRRCCLRTAQSTANHFLQPLLFARQPLAHVTELAFASRWRSQLEHLSATSLMFASYLAVNGRIGCASCATVERQLECECFLSPLGYLGHFSSLAHFEPSLPCLPRQAAPITSKMAPMVIALFYLPIFLLHFFVPRHCQIPMEPLHPIPTRPPLITLLQAPPGFYWLVARFQCFCSAVRQCWEQAAPAEVTPLALLRPSTTSTPPPLHLWTGPRNSFIFQTLKSLGLWLCNLLKREVKTTA